MYIVHINIRNPLKINKQLCSYKFATQGRKEDIIDRHFPTDSVTGSQLSKINKNRSKSLSHLLEKNCLRRL